MKKDSTFIVSQLYSVQHPAQNLAYGLYVHSFLPFSRSTLRQWEDSHEQGKV